MCFLSAIKKQLCSAVYFLTLLAELRIHLPIYLPITYYLFTYFN